MKLIIASLFVAAAVLTTVALAQENAGKSTRIIRLAQQPGDAAKRDPGISKLIGNSGAGGLAGSNIGCCSRLDDTCCKTIVKQQDFSVQARQILEAMKSNEPFIIIGPDDKKYLVTPGEAITDGKK